MKIEVPLSPYEEATVDKTPTTDENARSTTGRKATPFRVKKINTDDNSPSLRSFRLERVPLSDIGNGGSTVVTESVRPKATPDLITLTPLHIASNQKNSDDVTPTLVTGSAKKSSRRKDAYVGTIDLLSFDHDSSMHTAVESSQHKYSSTVEELREHIGLLEGELARYKEQGRSEGLVVTTSHSDEDALKQELSDLKDFIVEMDVEKRKLEKMLADEKDARVRLEQELEALRQARQAVDVTAQETFAMKEAAMQTRISSLKAMLRMVSLEKEKLVQYTMLERNLVEHQAAAVRK